MMQLSIEAMNEALARVQARYADTRITRFRVRAEPGPERPRLVGEVLTQEQAQAARDAITPAACDDQVRVRLTDATPWALVQHNVTDLRREPRRLSERLTQALVGESVRILEERDGWAEVQLDRDAYIGWMQLGALSPCTADAARAFCAGSDTRIRAEVTQAWSSPESAATMVGKLPFGVRLPAREQRAGRVALGLPDGTLWWVAESDVAPLSSEPEDVEHALARVRRFVGVPYLWGGRTPFGFDCSGLAQTFWAWLGVALPRDADQQFLVGQPVDGDPAPGDLLFFGEPTADGRDPLGRITHVAISLGGAEMIHSNGSAGGVSYNTLNPDRPLYRAWLREHLAGTRRYR